MYSLKFKSQAGVIPQSELLSLNMLVLNSRDQHDKMATKFYMPQNTPYKNLYLRKADLNTFLMLNNIALILNVTKIRIVRPIGNFKDFDFCPHFVCQLASQPAS